MLAEERQSVVDLAQRMVRDRLVVGTSGEHLPPGRGPRSAYPPSGTDYDTMTAEDIVVVTLDGDRVDGRLNPPTVEMPLHLMCYARHDAKAVVHTHSTAATALSLLQDEVPPVHYQLAMFGGSVAVAPYATYGTEALVNNVSNALSESTGAVMKHHGTICIGENLQKPTTAPASSNGCATSGSEPGASGEPALLPADEMERVVAGFLSYGKQPTGTQA